MNRRVILLSLNHHSPLILIFLIILIAIIQNTNLHFCTVRSTPFHLFIIFGRFMPERITIPNALANRAISGNAEAQFELAEFYMQSEHEDDITLAEEWALKAAENGNVEAMYWLGEGYTVYAKELAEEDPDEAKAHFELGYYWLSKANMQKHPAASLELAGYYRRGDVIEKDVAQSIKLVKQAAELGDYQAMRDLSFIYANALGTDEDETLADYWADKADQLQATQTTNK